MPHGLAGAGGGGGGGGGASGSAVGEAGSGSGAPYAAVSMPHRTQKRLPGWLAYPQFGQFIGAQPRSVRRRGLGPFARLVRWRRATTVLAGVAVVAAAGCATPGYNPTRIEAELMRAGATPQQARCVTNKFGDGFDLTYLGSHSEPTTDEIVQARLILKQCDVTLPLQPLP
jgi:hypothetical protein